MSGRTAVETVSWGGWAHNLRLRNENVEVIVTLDVGPRIIRYAPIDGPNVLKEVTEELGRSGEPHWTMRGGHRLWVSPEDPLRTYVADNGPVDHEVVGTRVCVTPKVDPSGIAKSLELQLDDEGTRLTLTHKMRNLASSTTRLAAWALTVMAPGGVAIVPLAPHRPHPGDGAPAEAYAPNQTIALWPYFDFTDDRVTWGRSFVRVRQDASRPPTKIGLGVPDGWAAYVRDGVVFTKRFVHRENTAYPDGGCNFECYTDNGVLELETLSPLVELAPGAEIEHSETWQLETSEKTARFDPLSARESEISALFSKIFERWR